MLVYDLVYDLPLFIVTSLLPVDCAASLSLMGPRTSKFQGTTNTAQLRQVPSVPASKDYLCWSHIGGVGG